MFLLTGCTNKKKHLTDLDIIKQRGYIIVGVKVDSPPFGYYKDSKLTGLDIKLANSIASSIFQEENPANIKFVPVTPQNRISMLNSKEVDILVATLSINEKRKLVMDFSTPYFQTSQKIMVRKTSKINNLNYFNKRGRLVVVMGTTGEKIVRLIAPNASLIGAKNYREAYNLLLNNQVDAILGDDCILAGLNDKNFRIVNKSYSNEYYGVAVRKSEDSKELLKIINGVVTTLLDKRGLLLITN